LYGSAGLGCCGGIVSPGVGTLRWGGLVFGLSLGGVARDHFKGFVQSALLGGCSSRGSSVVPLLFGGLVRCAGVDRGGRDDTVFRFGSGDTVGLFLLDLSETGIGDGGV